MHIQPAAPCLIAAFQRKMKISLDVCISHRKCLSESFTETKITLNGEGGGGVFLVVSSWCACSARYFVTKPSCFEHKKDNIPDY